MEIINTPFEKELIKSILDFNIDFFIDTFINFETIYEKINQHELSVETLKELRNKIDVSKNTRSIYKFHDVLTTYSSFIHYVDVEKKFYLILNEENFANNMDKYLEIIKKFLASIYNLLCELSEMAIKLTSNRKFKFLIFQANPDEPLNLDTKNEALDLKSKILNVTNDVIPIIRYGTSPKIFKRTTNTNNVIGIHFCCHGNPDSSLNLMGDWGPKTAFRVTEFIDFFKNDYKYGMIESVYFNSCYSYDFADRSFNSLKSYKVINNTVGYVGINETYHRSFSLNVYHYYFFSIKKFSIAFNTTKSNYLASSEPDENNYANNVYLFC